MSNKKNQSKIPFEAIRKKKNKKQNNISIEKNKSIPERPIATYCFKNWHKDIKK